MKIVFIIIINVLFLNNDVFAQENELQKDSMSLLIKLEKQSGDTLMILRISEPDLDSLQIVVDNLNQDIRHKNWKYVLSTSRVWCAKPVIWKEYKFNWNQDGSSGITIYGDEIRRR